MSGLAAVHPNELHESPVNPRTITAERFEALMYALEKAPKMMVPRPIIATLEGEVIGGNMRLRACRAMYGDVERYPRFNEFVTEHGGLPAYLDTFTPAERSEWMLRDNQGYGEYVEDQLADLLREYEQQADADMDSLGFMHQELDRLLDRGGDAGGDAPVDDTPPLGVYGVIVECESEEQQTELLERLAEEQYNVRALL